MKLFKNKIFIQPTEIITFFNTTFCPRLPITVAGSRTWSAVGVHLRKIDNKLIIYII